MPIVDKLKPRLRFKGFIDNWKQHKLEDFGSFVAGTSIEKDFSEGGIYKVISIGSYSEDSTYIDQGIRVNLTERTKNKILNKNDLAMILNDKTSSGRIIGRVLLIDKSDMFVFNQRTEKIEIDETFLIPKFVYVLLNAPNIRSKIVKQSQGNTQIYVNWSSIKRTYYKIPQIFEQQKIGTFFSNLDDIIYSNQKKLDKLICIKKSLLEKVFPVNGANIPAIRFKKYANTWKYTKLEDVCAISSGVNTPNNPSGMYYNLTMGSVSEEGKLLYSLKTNDASRLLKKGQLIMPTRDVGVGLIIGRVTYIPENDKFVAGNCLYVLDVNTVVTPLFLTYYVNSNNVRKQFARIISGGSQKQITLQNVYKLDICFPELLEEQEKLGSLISNLDDIIELYRHKLEKLKNIKKACLEDMLI